jgi:TPP-dependent 2-oxoacid decarboxylase
MPYSLAVHGKERKYNDVAVWQWQLALNFFGGDDSNSASYRVTTEGELLALLDTPSFQDGSKIQLVEMITDRFDSPAALVKQMEIVRLARVAMLLMRWTGGCFAIETSPTLRRAGGGQLDL